MIKERSWFLLLLFCAGYFMNYLCLHLFQNERISKCVLQIRGIHDIIHKSVGTEE